MDKVPGSTPLEQAMNLLKLTSKKQGESGGGEGGEQLPIFVDNENAEKSAGGLNNLLDTLESLSEDEKQLLDPDQDADAGASEGGDDGLQKMKLAEQMLAGKEEMLKISRNLDKLTRNASSSSAEVRSGPVGRRRP